ncbi:MAG: aspartyl/glutamyl-tRNA amidotransferase subunit C [Bdellovibrionales bacterium]|nr:aspartyl/glutamyl-tRNA amidotransferase subunit C [Bdellovibrionales bacterium]
MEKLSSKEIQNIAQLSSLRIAESEIEAQAEKFNSVLEAVAHLDRLDLEEMSKAQDQGLPSPLRLAKDHPQPSLEIEKVLQNSPGTQAPFFHIPGVLDPKA